MMTKSQTSYLAEQKPVKNLQWAFHLVQLLHTLLQMLDSALQTVSLLSSGCDLLLHPHGHSKT